jgi:hypothetical protein
MRAERTLEAGGLIGVSSGNVNGQSLGVEKLLLAGWALKRKMALVGLQMIVHRILILFCGLTDTAYKLTSRVLLIHVCHWLGYRCATCCINFSKLCLSLRLSPSLVAMAIVTATAIGLLRET